MPAYAATRAAFEEYSVLVLRGQEVTDELQLAFSRRFGPPEVTKVGSQGTGTHFVISAPLVLTARWCHQITGRPFAAKPTSSGILIHRSSACLHSHRSFRHASFRRAVAKPNLSRLALRSSGSMRPCAPGWRIPLPGTTTPHFAQANHGRPREP